MKNFFFLDYRLNFEEDIKKYLEKDFFTRFNYKESIRIIDLMLHKPGLEDIYFGIFQKNNSKIPSLETIIKDL